MSVSNNCNGVTRLFSAVLLLCVLSLEMQMCHSFSSNKVQSPPSKTQRFYASQKLQLQPNKNNEPEIMQQCQSNRRSFLQNCGAAVFGASALTQLPQASDAKADCMSDCLKECKTIAPKDSSYCLDNCKSYCAQEDRKDGLSGSVSSENGETGILGIGTVVKSEDKLPTLSVPGLDFTSGSGRKLLGY